MAELRYRKARKAENTVILNGFCKNTAATGSTQSGFLKNAGRIQTRRQSSPKLPTKRARSAVTSLITARTGTHTCRPGHPGVFRFVWSNRLVPVLRENTGSAADSARSGRGRFSNSGFPSALSGAGVINRRIRARRGKRRINSLAAGNIARTTTPAPDKRTATSSARPSGTDAQRETPTSTAWWTTPCDFSTRTWSARTSDTPVWRCGTSAGRRPGRPSGASRRAGMPAGNWRSACANGRQPSMLFRFSGHRIRRLKILTVWCNIITAVCRRLIVRFLHKTSRQYFYEQGIGAARSVPKRSVGIER